MANIVTKLWVEKYAPKHLEDMVLPDVFRSKFQSYIEEGECPHLLLSGGPGSGKGTTCRVLCNSIIKDDSDLLIFNGSKDTGVDNIRNSLDSFLGSYPLCSKIKIVWIDEADYLSQSAQAALRGIIEKYQESARFILTVNYLHKIIDPLKSRLQSFEFKKLPRDYIKNHVVKILENEKITFDIKDIDKIIDSEYPDVRKIIGTLQTKCLNGVLSIDSRVIEKDESRMLDYFSSLLASIKSGDSSSLKQNITNIQSLVNDDSSNIDYFSLYEKLFNHNIPFYAKLCVGESLETFSTAAIPSIHFMTCILKVVKAAMAAKGVGFNV